MLDILQRMVCGRETSRQPSDQITFVFNVSLYRCLRVLPLCHLETRLLLDCEEKLGTMTCSPVLELMGAGVR